MKKQHLFIILSVVLLGFVFGVIQYYQALKTEDVSAVTVGIPNPGHSLAQLECSADSLCVDTTNNRVGIGTAVPNAPLDVAASGTVKLIVGRNADDDNVVKLLKGAGAKANVIGAVNNGVSWTWMMGTNYLYQNLFSIFTPTPNPWGYTSDQMRFVIDMQTGNVGIGTITPSEKLSVAGTIGFETLKKDYTLTLGDGTYTAGTWYTLSGTPGAQYGDGMSYLAQISIQYDGRYSHWQHIGSGFISTVEWANSNYSYVTIPLTCHSEAAPITAYLMQESTGMDHNTVIAIKFDTTLTVANGGYIRVYLKRIF